MAIHPIDSRYATQEMRAIFSEESILQKRLLVEAAVAKAHASVGNIPKAAAEEIARHANTKEVTLQRVEEIEKETQHDIMGLVKALTEKCPSAGKYVHLGITSYDVVDTAWALIFKDALKIIGKDLKELKKILLEGARQYKDLVMVGRTHGQHAVPTTLGLKFAVYACEIERHLQRITEAERVIGVGKLTGAVGTAASLGKHAVKIQVNAMKELGLEAPLVTTQIIQRDRHAQVIFALVLVGQTLEKIAKEIRNLQRTEIGEIEEPFKEKQVGSSTMPQKRNPTKSERICGVARYLRSNVLPALENIPLEHERDLSNSSCERIIFPETFVLCHYILKEMIKIMQSLKIYPASMRQNLEMTKGRIMAESIMIRLSEKGMNRQEAHEVVRRLSMRSFEKDLDFVDLLKKEPVVRKYLKEKEIEDALKPESYIGTAVEQVENVLKEIG